MQFTQNSVIAPAVVAASPTRVVPVKETRVLGILQIVIGGLFCVFGIAIIAALGSSHWVAHVGFGIWGGIWILIGGTLGVFSASNPSSQGLNGTNMAFAIVSSCISFLDIIFYSIAVAYYRSHNTCYYIGYYPYTRCYSSGSTTGVGLSVMLLLCVLAEFVVSIIVAVYCCKLGCGCCDTGTTGVIVQQQPVVFQAPGVTFTQQPVVSYAGGPVISQQYGQPQMQVAYSSPAYIQPTQSTVVTTVTNNQPPPAYTAQ